MTVEQAEAVAEEVVKENPNLLFLIKHQGDARIIALQGSARSGKTYSTLHFLIGLAHFYSGLIISIVRGFMPALRATVLRDFKEIMENAGLFDEDNESKPSGYYEYQHNGNTFEFFGVDNQQKVRGRKRHILYINEANEITLAQFRQLAMRTEGLIIIDYNPSDPESYIYDNVLTRSDCLLLITTYLDNPHLPQAIIDEIELLKDTDPEYWKVFGQGQRGDVSGIAYSHYQILEDDKWPKLGQGIKVYGIDFGFTAPSTVMEVTIYDESLYVRQLLYKRKLTNPDLIAEVKKLGISKNDTLWCDEAEPDRIEDFKREGFDARAAEKPIKAGVDAIRSRKLFIHVDSYETITEIKGYRNPKDPVTGEYSEKPVGIDHAMDGMRYAVYNHFKNTIRPTTKASRPQGRSTMSL